MTAWGRRFTWEGHDVAMMVTDVHGESHEIEPRAPVMIGVNLWNDGGTFVEWVQRPDTEDGEYVDPENVRIEGDIWSPQSRETR
jgi:hypothetical protein